jgi:hypothetical protein
MGSISSVITGSESVLLKPVVVIFCRLLERLTWPPPNSLAYFSHSHARALIHPNCPQKKAALSSRLTIIGHELGKTKST